MTSESVGPWFKDWDCKGWFQTADGDRCAVMACANWWAVMWTYGAPHGPQLTTYTRPEDASTAFRQMRRRAARKAPLAYDSREAWASESI
jgi:hypothetical protein